MLAKEFMIGDWVNHNKNPIRISGAVDFTIAKDFDPILLTAEILEKNGWEWVSHRDDKKGTMDDMFYSCVGHIYFYSDGYAKADIIGNGVGYNGNGQFRGKTNYIHTLQHALRLCGLTDLADNFQV